MGGLLRRLGPALAIGAIAGGIAAAAPADETVVKRSVRIPTTFVPAIDPADVPGFTVKFIGDRVVYCRKEQKIGTRFRTETCIDQANMAQYLAALEENRRQVKDLGSGETRIN
jgi:hypothetical protein